MESFSSSLYLIPLILRRKDIFLSYIIFLEEMIFQKELISLKMNKTKLFKIKMRCFYYHKISNDINK